MGAAHLRQGDDAEDAGCQERPQPGGNVAAWGQRGSEVAGEPVRQGGQGRASAGARMPGVADLHAPSDDADLADVWAGCRRDGIAQGAPVDAGLLGGNEPAAQAQQVPQEVRGVAGEGVTPGVLEI